MMEEIASSSKRNLQVIEAIRALRAGEPVVFPTDTVYGIGVAVRYAKSLEAIYRLKGRDEGKPVAWLVGGPAALDEYGIDVPGKARELAGAHWPGALTIIVKASGAVPAAFLPASGTIGLRMPAHDVALELIREVGPIATSSANVSGRGDPHSFSDLDARLLQGVGAFVQEQSEDAATVGAADQGCQAVGGRRAPANGTEAMSGVASTVVDCSSGELRVLRAGDIIVS